VIDERRLSAADLRDPLIARQSVGPYIGAMDFSPVWNQLAHSIRALPQSGC
jgi:hypothetical protein